MKTAMLTIVLCLAATITQAAEKPAPKPVEPLHAWNGSRPDATLQAKAPNDGFIAAAEPWEALRKNWALGPETAVVDFTKQLVLVATTPGSRIGGKPSLTDEGDLRFMPFATMDLGEGFRYLILVVPRDGVKTVNGKPLAALAPADAPAPADKPKGAVAPVHTWRGSIADEALQAKAPQDHFLATGEAWDALRKAWMLGDETANVDLTKHLVLVATTNGSRLLGNPSLGEDGDLKFAPISTRDLRPGFRYLIHVVSRAGVKTVNGKAI